MTDETRAEIIPLRQKYFLVAGELVFVDEKDLESKLNVIRVNTVVFNSTGTFSIRQIAHAQQALQQNFFNRMNGGGTSIEGIKVVDVVILGFNFCGEFTNEEFNDLPPPVAEVAPEAPSEAKTGS